MHGDRNKFQAQTLRGVRAGQGPSACRESHGDGLAGGGQRLGCCGPRVAWQSCGGRVWRFTEQRARARSHSQLDVEKSGVSAAG